MFYVKYRDFFGELQVLSGRSEFEDAQSEAEDCASAGSNSEVEILVTLEAADENMELVEADSRRFIVPGVERGWPASDHGSLVSPTSPSSGG